MITKQSTDEIVVTFTAADVQSLGGPARGCSIKYRNGMLDDLSAWLFKQTNLEPLIDRLQALADTHLATLH